MVEYRGSEGKCGGKARVAGICLFSFVAFDAHPPALIGALRPGT